MDRDTLLVKVEKAEYLKDYQVRLTFSDGLSGVVDLKQEIWGEVFEPLKDVEYFKTFTKDRWTIGWDCGADFAPEFLHKLTLQQNPKLIIQ
ncbi:DUF2442 domain-containing protein [Marinoscillum furvescens]|uniref:Uncharacterized protein DUF2442 n=1 Tax=Marinoscillum furvescens DSM 4134 TaxID=1122208 RepID=A0A3D9KXB4_MARFU|nr:DUF2442 domain-containing protein [Marinoscillum furvescens]RED91330.1 uncharacterized protein DUF2442 [Marinoscillum furvescens DSM 4134]